MTMTVEKANKIKAMRLAWQKMDKAEKNALSWQALTETVLSLGYKNAMDILSIAYLIPQAIIEKETKKFLLLQEEKNALEKKGDFNIERLEKNMEKILAKIEKARNMSPMYCYNSAIHRIRREKAKGLSFNEAIERIQDSQVEKRQLSRLSNLTMEVNFIDIVNNIDDVICFGDKLKIAKTEYDSGLFAIESEKAVTIFSACNGLSTDERVGIGISSSRNYNRYNPENIVMQNLEKVGTENVFAMLSGKQIANLIQWKQQVSNKVRLGHALKKSVNRMNSRYFGNVSRNKLLDIVHRLESQKMAEKAEKMAVRFMAEKPNLSKVSGIL